MSFTTPIGQTGRGRTRGRSGSPGGGPPASRLRIHVYHPNIDDARADIILRSIDGISFALERAPLVAASSVFADMFALPRDPPPSDVASSSTSSTPRDSLEIVDLAEGSNTLSRLIRYAYPRFYFINGEPPVAVVTFLNVERFLNAAEKYDAPIILHTAARVLLPRLLDELQWPIQSWYLACRFGHLDLARAALRKMPHHPIVAPPPVPYDELLRQTNPTSPALLALAQVREMGLGDLPLHAWERLPAVLLQRFARLQARVAVGTRMGTFTWHMAAEEFTF